MRRPTSSGWLTVVMGVGLTSSALAQPVQDDPDKSNENNQSGATAPVNPQGTATTADATGTVQGSATVQLGTQPTYVPPPPPPPPTITVQEERPDDVAMPKTRGERAGVAISAGAGASGFTNDQLRGTTNVGGEWDVRLTMGTRSPLAFEASYIGSAQPINALGLSNDAMLVGNGVQGALRLNGTIDLPVQPFIFGGAAWRHYAVTNTTTNTSDISNKDDVLEIPMGVGLAGTYEGLILDARGEFRYTTNNDLLRANGIDIGSTNDFASMHRWGVNASVGYEF